MGMILIDNFLIGLVICYYLPENVVVMPESIKKLETCVKSEVEPRNVCHLYVRSVPYQLPPITFL